MIKISEAIAPITVQLSDSFESIFLNQFSGEVVKILDGNEAEKSLVKLIQNQMGKEIISKLTFFIF